MIIQATTALDWQLTIIEQTTDLTYNTAHELFRTA